MKSFVFSTMLVFLVVSISNAQTCNGPTCSLPTTLAKNVTRTVSSPVTNAAGSCPSCSGASRVSFPAPACQVRQGFFARVVNFVAPKARGGRSCGSCR